MNKFLLAEIEELKAMVDVLKWIIVFGTITFFASHLTIITQLPKIRRLLETICFDTEEKEEKYKEKQFKEDKYFLLRCVVYASVIGIVIICAFL